MVEDTGFGVTTLKAGDEVYGLPWFPRAAGAYAVYVVSDLVGDHHETTSTRALQVLRPGGLIVAIPAGVSEQLRDAAEARGVRA
ncbi:hypothetical protein UK12_33995, partial [Saccharothrix sp. ST-888]